MITATGIRPDKIGSVAPSIQIMFEMFHDTSKYHDHWGRPSNVMITGNIALTRSPASTSRHWPCPCRSPVSDKCDPGLCLSASNHSQVTRKHTYSHQRWPVPRVGSTIPHTLSYIWNCWIMPRSHSVTCFTQ